MGKHIETLSHWDKHLKTEQSHPQSHKKAMIIAAVLLCNIIVFSADEEGLYLFHAAILSLRVMQTQNDWSEKSSQRRKEQKKGGEMRQERNIA